MSRFGCTLLAAGLLAVGACGLGSAWAEDGQGKAKDAGEVKTGDTDAYHVGDKVLYLWMGNYKPGIVESITRGKVSVRNDFTRQIEPVSMEWLKPYLELEVGEKVCWVGSFGALKTGEVVKVDKEQITVKIGGSPTDASAAPKASGPANKTAGGNKATSEMHAKAMAKALSGEHEEWVDLGVIFRGEKLPADRFASINDIELGTRVAYIDTFKGTGTGKVVGFEKVFNSVKVKDDRGGREVSAEVWNLKNLDVDVKTGGPVAGAPAKTQVWSKVREITLRGGVKGAVSFTPGPAKAVPKLSGAVLLGRAPGATVRGVVDVVGPERSVAVVDYVGDQGVWYSLVDMAGGQAKDPVFLEPGKRVLAASPDGTRLACDTGKNITIWKIDGDKPQKVVSFKAQFQTEDEWASKDRLVFINSERLVAICGGSKYVGWDISGVPTAVWTAATSAMDSVGDVDPARTAVIVPNNWESQVLNPLTGAVMATLSTRPAWESAHFSPSGKRIHARFQQEYMVLDVTNPASRVKYILQDLQWGNGDAPHWLGPETTLLGQDKVFNTRLGVYTGKFGKGAWPFVTPDGRLVTVSRKGDGSCYLTDEVAQSAEIVGVASKVTPEQAMYYKPGDAVSIEVHVTGIEKGEQRARARLVGQLKAQGSEVAEGRPVKILVSVLDLPRSTLTAWGGADKSKDKEVPYTPVEYRVEVFSGGQSVWKHVQTYRGPTGFKKPDQSWDDFILSGRRGFEKFVDEFEVPRGVPRPEKELEALFK